MSEVPVIVALIAQQQAAPGNAAADRHGPWDRPGGMEETVETILFIAAVCVAAEVFYQLNQWWRKP